jgi:hypothetical protein
MAKKCISRYKLLTQYIYTYIYTHKYRSFHATRMVEHERVGHRKSVQQVWSDNRSGQLLPERKRKRTVPQQCAHEPIFFARQQEKIRIHNQTRRIKMPQRP